MKDDFLFGAIAVREGFITQAQLDECLRTRDGRPLGLSLRERGYLTEPQVQAILDIQRIHVAEADAPSESGGLFGQIALNEGYITPGALQEAVQEQLRLRDEGKRVLLGQILCQKGYLSLPQLQEILLKQDKHTLACPQCDTYYLVQGYTEGTKFVCRQCLSVLTVPNVSTLSVEAAIANPKGQYAAAPFRLSHEAEAFGPYDVETEIGRGSAGVVYRARHRESGKVVALKILRERDGTNPDLLQRFRREARVFGRLSHPNIVAIRDFGEEEGVTYIAMDYIDGMTLRRALLERRGTMRRLLGVFHKVVRAVDYAHRQGIIHRDLKPANILLDAHGEPHVMDFGLAKVDHADGPVTRTGKSFGTPHYMSPEQVHGDVAGTDARSDIYSLGCILYEILTGRVPFAGTGVMQVYREILTGEAAPPSKVNPASPAALDGVCLKALARDKRGRYAVARELADEVERFLSVNPGFEAPLPAAEGTKVRTP